MNTHHSIGERLLRRLRARRGSVVAVADLLDLGTRAAIDQALSRLVRQGRVQRVQRGLYQSPRTNSLLQRPITPSPDAVVRAWARKNGLRVVPCGTYAANLLGLTTQVPAHIVYYTNGRTKTVVLGPYTVKFLNRGPKTVDVQGTYSPLVFQALRYLGRDKATPAVLDQLRRNLPVAARAELQRNVRHSPAWMRPLLQSLIVLPVMPQGPSGAVFGGASFDEAMGMTMRKPISLRACSGLSEDLKADRQHHAKKDS